MSFEKEFSFGRSIKLYISGSSHGESVNLKLCGLPVGVKIELDGLCDYMSRRKPANLPFSTQRLENDDVIFCHGIDENGVITGDISAKVMNNNANSADYGETSVPRPSHSDYTSFVKYGKIFAGGGMFSGRMTAPLCIAGYICEQLLIKRGILILSHLQAAGDVFDRSFEFPKDLSLYPQKETLSLLDRDKEKKFNTLFEKTKKDRDSIGGLVECAICGLDAGLGDALFDGLESRLSAVMFGIPGVKSIVFGANPLCYGSQYNDAFRYENGKVVTETNRCGGIQGGITNGMPVVFTVGFKPTPSIGITQKSINLKDNTPADLTISGRHDVCIAVRGTVCVQAAAAVAIYDLIKEEEHNNGTK